MSVESISKAIDRSITNDMRTYSVVENDDFTNSAKVLEVVVSPVILFTTVQWSIVY